MKRIFAMLLCLLTVFALAGCGAEEGGNEITALYDEGYCLGMCTYDETSWAGLFQKEDSTETVYKVTAAMTAKQYEAYSEISFEDEDSEEKTKDILGQLSDVVVTDISGMVPSQEELDSYIGMTFGELEEAGFENSGYIGDEETGYRFFYDGPVFSCTVSTEEGTVITNMDDYSANDIRALKIGGMEFTGFSFNVLEGTD